MHYPVLASSQPTQSYSLIGLMYGQQYSQYHDYRGVETLQQDVLASHIADFCDCV